MHVVVAGQVIIEGLSTDVLRRRMLDIELDNVELAEEVAALKAALVCPRASVSVPAPVCAWVCPVISGCVPACAFGFGGECTCARRIGLVAVGLRGDCCCSWVAPPRFRVQKVSGDSMAALEASQHALEAENKRLRAKLDALEVTQLLRLGPLHVQLRLVLSRLLLVVAGRCCPCVRFVCCCWACCVCACACVPECSARAVEKGMPYMSLCASLSMQSRSVLGFASPFPPPSTRASDRTPTGFNYYDLSADLIGK